MSIFLTGSNSYLLSGELVTKLTGRKIEMFTLNFYEYIEMKKMLGKDINSNINLEFQDYVVNGGFPETLKYDGVEDRRSYVTNILSDIFIKDVKANEKISEVNIFQNNVTE